MSGNLIINGDISLPLLQQKINEKAGRFIVFSYCIGLGFVTLKRMSPAIFIQKEEDFLRYKKYYNRLNYLLGFIGVPYGWIYAPNNIIANNKGGIDVTEDVMLNITEVSLQQKKIEFKKTSMIFDFPDKNDEKIFRNILTKQLRQIKILTDWQLDGI